MDGKKEDLRDGRREPTRVQGGNLPAVVHDLHQPLNQEVERETEATPNELNEQRRSGHE